MSFTAFDLFLFPIFFILYVGCMFDWVCVLYFIIVGHLLLAVNLDLMMSYFFFLLVCSWVLYPYLRRVGNSE